MKRGGHAFAALSVGSRRVVNNRDVICQWSLPRFNPVFRTLAGSGTQPMQTILSNAFQAHDRREAVGQWWWARSSCRIPINTPEPEDSIASLPNASVAEVADEKILGYLLAENHPGGRSKARFLKGLGFDEADPQALREALLRIARDGQVVAEVRSRFGTKHIVDGYLQGPAGSAWVRTVWIVDRGTITPRLVTAYPALGPAE